MYCKASSKEYRMDLWTESNDLNLQIMYRIISDDFTASMGNIWTHQLLQQLTRNPWAACSLLLKKTRQLLEAFTLSSALNIKVWRRRWGGSLILQKPCFHLLRNLPKSMRLYKDLLFFERRTSWLWIRKVSSPLCECFEKIELYSEKVIQPLFQTNVYRF